MTIYTKDKSKIIDVGSPSFLYCFYSTICLRIPKSVNISTGITFLQSGYVSGDDCIACAHDFEQVRKIFMALPPDKVVWNMEHQEQQPPWGKNISPHIRSLGNYFVTATGEDLLEEVIQLLHYAGEHNLDVRIG